MKDVLKVVLLCLGFAAFGYVLSWLASTDGRYVIVPYLLGRAFTFLGIAGAILLPIVDNK